MTKKERNGALLPAVGPDTYDNVSAFFPKDFTVTAVTQPWFSTMDILFVQPVQEPLTQWGYFGKCATHAVSLLSGHPDNLNHLILEHPPTVSGDGAMITYALDCDRWTWGRGKLINAVATLDDVVWRPRSADDEAKIKQLNEAALEVGPPRVQHANGITEVTYWLLTGAKLVRREIVVSPEATIQRRDTVAAKDLPDYEPMQRGRRPSSDLGEADRLLSQTAGKSQRS